MINQEFVNERNEYYQTLLTNLKGLEDSVQKIKYEINDLGGIPSHELTAFHLSIKNEIEYISKMNPSMKYAPEKFKSKFNSYFGKRIWRSQVEEFYNNK